MLKHLNELTSVNCTKWQYKDLMARNNYIKNLLRQNTYKIWFCSAFETQKHCCHLLSHQKTGLACQGSKTLCDTLRKGHILQTKWLNNHAFKFINLSCIHSTQLNLKNEHSAIVYSLLIFFFFFCGSSGTQKKIF